MCLVRNIALIQLKQSWRFSNSFFLISFQNDWFDKFFVSLSIFFLNMYIARSFSVLKCFFKLILFCVLCTCGRSHIIVFIFLCNKISIWMEWFHLDKPQEIKYRILSISTNNLFFHIFSQFLLLLFVLTIFKIFCCRCYGYEPVIHLLYKLILSLFCFLFLNYFVYVVFKLFWKMKFSFNFFAIKTS